MLSFEIADNGHTIKIFFDKAGLKILSDTVEQLKQNEGVEIQLFSPDRGGSDLSGTNPWGDLAVSEVLFCQGGD